MRTSRRLVVCAAALPITLATTAHADDDRAVHVGGYIQPAYRVRQDDDVAQFDEDGFRVRRARLTASARQDVDPLELSVSIETELTPEVTLLDAYVTAASCLIGEGRWRVDGGQVKAPISRQTLLSDSRLGFVEKAELASLAPDRQIGVLGTIATPYLPMLRIAGGAFNGEGRNQGQNIDENFLFAGRVEVVPLGRDVGLAESAHGGDFVSVAASAGRNRLDIGDGIEVRRYLGADVAFAFRGLSGSVEYLQVRSDFQGASVQPDYLANGLVAQAAYLVPFGPLRDHLEAAVRFEEIDRNDTLPIERRGDANQSLRYLTAAVSWYQRGHDLKVQVQASHITELEDRDRNGMLATYDNDTVLVQATYRME